VDLRDYVRLLRKRLLLVLACLIVGVGAAVALIATTTPTYSSSVQLFVSAVNSADSSNAASGSQFTQDRVKSYASIVAAPAVADSVISELRLPFDSRQLAQKVSATAPLNTTLVTITVTDTNPGRARDIANAVGQQFSAYVTTLEAPSVSGGSPVKVTVVKPAIQPGSKVSPKRTLDLALGVLLGLAVGVGSAVLRETLDRSVRSLEDAAEITGAAPLAAIMFDPDARKAPLISDANPHGVRAEAFRQLRTNLQFIDPDAPPKVVVVTSALPDEGKSTTAANLAIAAATAGRRIVLVEADMRRPRLSHYFGVEPGLPGLSDVLVGRAPLELPLLSVADGTLALLPAGSRPPNPSELLGSHAMLDLLQRLRGQCDLVIIDAPPLLPVTDAAILGARSDGTLLVTRAGKTTREQLQRARAALTVVDARVLGVVLNMVSAKAISGDYGYGYYTYEQRPPRKVAGTGKHKSTSVGAWTPAVFPLASHDEVGTILDERPRERRAANERPRRSAPPPLKASESMRKTSVRDQEQC